MFGIGEYMQNLASNVITVVIILSIIGITVMYLVNKLTGDLRAGSFAAGTAILLFVVCLNKKGILIEFLSTIR